MMPLAEAMRRVELPGTPADLMAFAGARGLRLPRLRVVLASMTPPAVAADIGDFAGFVSFAATHRTEYEIALAEMEVAREGKQARGRVVACPA